MSDELLFERLASHEEPAALDRAFEDRLHCDPGAGDAPRTVDAAGAAAGSDPGAGAYDHRRHRRRIGRDQAPWLTRLVVPNPSPNRAVNVRTFNPRTVALTDGPLQAGTYVAHPFTSPSVRSASRHHPGPREGHLSARPGGTDGGGCWPMADAGPGFLQSDRGSACRDRGNRSLRTRRALTPARFVVLTRRPRAGHHLGRDFRALDRAARTGRRQATGALPCEPGIGCPTGFAWTRDSSALVLAHSEALRLVPVDGTRRRASWRALRSTAISRSSSRDFSVSRRGVGGHWRRRDAVAGDGSGSQESAIRSRGEPGQRTGHLGAGPWNGGSIDPPGLVARWNQDRLGQMAPANRLFVHASTMPTRRVVRISWTVDGSTFGRPWPPGVVWSPDGKTTRCSWGISERSRSRWRLPHTRSSRLLSTDRLISGS